MPRVRLELDQKTYDALVGAAVRERRPIPWQAEVIIRRALGTQPDDRMPPEVAADASDALDERLFGSSGDMGQKA